MKISMKSAISGIMRERDIPVEAEHLEFWKLGYGNIQELMPYLSDSEREFLISGIVDEEWNLAFEGNDEEI